MCKVLRPGGYKGAGKVDRKQTGRVISYYYAIPEMVRLLETERAELDAEYDALGAANMDGMPRGHTPGRPAEDLAAALGERGTLARRREIEDRIRALQSDAAEIRACLDCLHGRYKRLIIMRYAHRYTWVQISTRMEIAESTARVWHDAALRRLGEALERMPQAKAILGRASRARV